MRHRRHAREVTAAARSAAHAVDPHVNPVLPSYFIDRYALMSHPAVQVSIPLSCTASHSSERAIYLRSILRPTARLDGWMPDPDQLTGVGATYRWLRQAWAAYASRLALPTSAAKLRDASTHTWAQVIDDSVFYPGPPVFRGATYFDQLPEQVAKQILDEVGWRGVIDFYCFMLQVHETMHQHQTGEPLLNEVIQAGLWIRFLDEYRLWMFQTGTKGSLVREATVLRCYPDFSHAAAIAQLDTAVFIRSIATDNAYMACCLLARQFDLGIIRYAEYLTRLSGIFAIRHDRGAVRTAIMALL